MPRSADREKQTASLASAINHNLSLYALAAGAAGVQLLALAQPSEAEVVYTSAHVVLGRDQLSSIDLNHDGINDFTIYNRYSRSSYSYKAFQLRVTADRGGAIAYGAQDIFGDLATLFIKGDKIGTRAKFDSRRVIMALRYITGGGYGAWFNVKNGYLGLRFKINGQIHYGWARLNVQSNQRFRIVATLTGYAYETQPDTPIIAGDTGGAADEEGLAEPMSQVPQGQGVTPSATLAALSLGAPGLAIWRRPIP
jgi:hypothetical protein